MTIAVPPFYVPRSQNYRINYFARVALVGVSGTVRQLLMEVNSVLDNNRRLNPPNVPLNERPITAYQDYLEFYRARKKVYDGDVQD